VRIAAARDGHASHDALGERVEALLREARKRRSSPVDLALMLVTARVGMPKATGPELVAQVARSWAHPAPCAPVSEALDPMTTGLVELTGPSELAEGYSPASSHFRIG